MSNKVYSGTWHTTLADNTSANINFAIRSNGRELRIKSIALTLAIYEVLLSERLDYRAIKSIIRLTTGAASVNSICSSFSSPSVPPAFMGNYIEIYEPFQYFFDGFFVANELPFNLWIVNKDNTIIEYQATVIVETEEKSVFPQ